MKFKVFLLFSLFLLVSSVFSEGKSHHEDQNDKAKENKPATVVPTGFGGGMSGYGGYGGGGVGSTDGSCGGVNVGGTGSTGGNSGNTGGDSGASGGGGGGSDGDGKGWKSGWSHGGVYGTGQHCFFGCCSKSFGASIGGGYANCKCCMNAEEATLYKENQEKAETKN